MNKHGKLLGLCQNCVRYHPKAMGNCLLAKDAMLLAGRWKKYNLMVTDCELFLPPKEVFPLEPEKDTNGAAVEVGAVLEKEEDDTASE